MVSSELAAVIGLGTGAVAGYVARSVMGGGILPRIVLKYQGVEVPENRIPASTPYDMYCFNFPPNAQLVGPISLGPSQIANVGTTDALGNLTVPNVTSPNTPGVYYIIVWNALDGSYCAMTTLIVI